MLTVAITFSIMAFMGYIISGLLDQHVIQLIEHFESKGK